MIEHLRRALALHAGLRLPGEWTYISHDNYHRHYSSIKLLWFYHAVKFLLAVTKISSGQQTSQRRCLVLPSTDISFIFPLTLANWFHLQWSDGPKESATRIHKTILHFSNMSTYGKVFVSSQENRGLV